MRLDHLKRPELCHGTVDFAVPQEYWASNPPEGITTPFISLEPPLTGERAPLPLDYVFALDVSNEAVQSGLLATACLALRTVLYGGSNDDGSFTSPCLPPQSNISIFTFDSTLHFYDLSVRSFFPSMLVASLTSYSQMKSQCWFSLILKKFSFLCERVSL